MPKSQYQLSNISPYPFQQGILLVVRCTFQKAVIQELHILDKFPFETDQWRLSRRQLMYETRSNYFIQQKT